MATIERSVQMITVHDAGYGESGASSRRVPLRAYALCFAFLTCLFPLSQASAQPAQVPSDFSGLGGARTIIVADDSGKETRGRLLRFTPNSLTMTVEGRELVFAPQDVRTIYERGDTLTNGAKIGFYAGAALGFAAGVTAKECGVYMPAPCDSGDKFILAALGVGVFGGAGAGIGAGIDALIRGRRLLYERPGSSGIPAVSIEPSFAPSFARLLLSVAW